jgi:hypothetical protein
MAVGQVVDDYAQRHPSDDDVNVNCVCSWRFVERGDSQEVAVDFHNGWMFHSGATQSSWVSRARRDRLVGELRRIGGILAPEHPRQRLRGPQC